MAASCKMSRDRCYTWVPAVITVVSVIGLGLFFYHWWPEIQSATAVNLGKIAGGVGGVGTCLALVWLICGNFQQTARFRARSSPRTKRVFSRSSCLRMSGRTGGWEIINAGKGTAVNVDVYGAGDNDDWDQEHSVRFPTISVGDTDSPPRLSGATRGDPC